MVAFFLTSLFFALLHGSVPIHYLLVLFPFVIIFGARIIIKSKFVGILILTVLTVFSFKYFVAIRPWSLVTYAQQLKVVEVIIKDAQGKQFELKRRGMFEEFDGNFAQNYQYLLWWKGNEPVQKANLVYTIYEKEAPASGSAIIFSAPDLWITRVVK